MSLTIRMANYSDAEDACAIAQLMNSYAKDPMGGGTALDAALLENLAVSLDRYPTAFTLLAFHQHNPAGLVTCFESLSTFKCRPLINIHDVVVKADYRKQGVARKMLKAIEVEARSRACCKLTLEVLEGNSQAQSVYRRFGFAGYQLAASTGQALFWEKAL